MAKTLKITTDSRIQLVDVDFSRMEDITKELGGDGERVCTQKLQDYFGPGPMMFVDEQGLLKRLPITPVGSFFYGTALHGNPIAGDFILAVLENGYWKAPEGKLVEEWKARLKKDFWLEE